MSGPGFKGLDLSGKVAIVTGASRYERPRKEPQGITYIRYLSL